MKLYLKFLALHMKTQMQYKLSFILVFISQFFKILFLFLGMNFLFATFKSLSIFSREEVLLCFSVVSFAFSLARCVSEGFDSFSMVILNAEFDKVLIRPCSSMFLTFVSKLEFHQLGSLVQSILILIYAILKIGIQWDICKILVLILMLISGVTTFIGLFILNASMCFFTMEGIGLINLFIQGGQNFWKYPLAVYGKTVLNFFTYIIPMALFQYYPLLYLLDKDKCVLNALVPLLAILFLIPCDILWRVGVNRYQSSGS